ncbi:pirin family protein [Zobellia alginiliquefaciens]|uniref:pirin family protein n=1 Tax=Zobellia alginiliquefaciens TaxID=3032586 RepID=UPI0023E41FC6|nr:pirin family protein [Zobellia alginiliquefaciens]
MKTRTVELVVKPKDPHFVGDGFRVHNFIPSGFRLDMERMNPFIMMDYNSKFHFSATDSPRGVDVHPHRGFETVTIAYKGKVAHHDSSGGGGVISEGDVQWMTAASGVLHKEYHEEEWAKKGGDFQMVQLWVNLPKKDKMSEPKYQAIKKENLNRFKLPNKTGEVEVIAGEYNAVKGAASTFTPINMFNARLEKGGKVDFSFPENYNTVLLVIEGSVTVNGTDHAPTDHLVLMANDGENFTVEASEDALVLVLSGDPLNEPIAAHGPFVMNTREELMQAFHDFNNGKFGYLEN